jgi:hypothetical protein
MGLRNRLKNIDTRSPNWIGLFDVIHFLQGSFLDLDSSSADLVEEALMDFDIGCTREGEAKAGSTIEKQAKVKWDEKCKKRYQNEQGRFKGGPGDRFSNCVLAVKNCSTGVKDPEAFCAYVGRKSPRWPKKKGTVLASQIQDLALAERVAAKKFALSHGETQPVADFYADEVENVLFSCATCAGLSDNDIQSAVDNPGEASSQKKRLVLRCPGSKIRSKGKGRGLGRGMGLGPMGLPVLAK